MDSIQNKYELAKKVTSEVEKRRDAINNEADKMQAAYNSKLNGYQQRAATMTEEQAIAAREDMESTQRTMMEKRQALDQEFGQWASSKNLSLMKDIQDYLKKFNADGTYSFIFSYEPGFFYYSNPANDITSEVLKGLNQQYSSSSKKE
ncbi:OmpH family outer membrane protein [Niabella ginsengisoli]|uniref:OmpH family outer membrane protein n=1 Tax=Niabella ginsengisoli TaxID=522298 RepID=A0ABS9SQG5_9BACT|nr:OmpH family outer membrane protein [Niabella ginsengisoli]MCH5600638.1 OmpH family outer membrane protein [Niabella ginsengisoli]